MEPMQRGLQMPDKVSRLVRWIGRSLWDNWLNFAFTAIMGSVTIGAGIAAIVGAPLSLWAGLALGCIGCAQLITAASLKRARNGLPRIRLSVASGDLIYASPLRHWVVQQYPDGAEVVGFVGHLRLQNSTPIGDSWNTLAVTLTEDNRGWKPVEIHPVAQPSLSIDEHQITNISSQSYPLRPLGTAFHELVVTVPIRPGTALRLVGKTGTMRITLHFAKVGILDLDIPLDWAKLLKSDADAA